MEILILKPITKFVTQTHQTEHFKKIHIWIYFDISACECLGRFGGETGNVNSEPSICHHQADEMGFCHCKCNQLEASSGFEGRP